jgi:hypothetical protein
MPSSGLEPSTYQNLIHDEITSRYKARYKLTPKIIQA